MLQAVTRVKLEQASKVTSWKAQTWPNRQPWMPQPKAAAAAPAQVKSDFGAIVT